MPFYCQYCVLFGQCVCLKMEKINIKTISGTLGACMASFCICAYC